MQAHHPRPGLPLSNNAQAIGNDPLLVDTPGREALQMNAAASARIREELMTVQAHARDNPLVAVKLADLCGFIGTWVIFARMM